MTERERRIFNYWYLKGWTTKYEDEADLLRDTKEMLEMLPEILVVRTTVGTRSGVADLVVCYKGKFVAIELKDRTGTLSEPQRKFLAETIDAGGIAGECRTLAAVWDLLMRC